MDTFVPAKSRMRLALIAAAALALLATLALTTARADAAAKTYFPANCTKEAYKPLNITLSCADGKTSFQTTHWNRWGSLSASTIGAIVFPDCGEEPLVNCNNYTEEKAKITLSVAVNCHGRLQFTKMVIKDLQPGSPGQGESIRYTVPCGGVG